MARAYGWAATMLAAFESAYGTAPGTGYTKLPFVSSTLGAEQGLIQDDLVGTGRDPEQPIRDVINADGQIVVPVDLRYLGIWLKLLLGDPDTTEVTGTFTHVFISGKTALPSAAIEIGHPQVPAFFLNEGVRLDSIQLTFQRSGQANATLQAIAQGEMRDGTTKDAEPASIGAAIQRFNQFQGSIKKDATPLANVTQATITYSNNLDRVETIRDDGKIEAVDPGSAALTGSLQLRFADTVLLAAAEAGTPVDLEVGYRINDDKRLRVLMPQIYLPKPRQAVDGPGGISATYDIQGAKAADGGPMLEVRLINDVETY